MARDRRRGRVCILCAAVAVCSISALTAGCNDELYPQYSGTFLLASEGLTGEPLDGTYMPRVLYLAHWMRHSGSSFTHYLVVEAPDVPANVGRARGRFVVPLNALLHEPSAGTSESVPDYPGAQVLPARHLVKLGPWCSVDALYTVYLDAGASTPSPALVRSVYRGSTVDQGMEVQVASNAVHEAPIDEEAREACLTSTWNRGGLRITLVLARRKHRVVSGCSADQPVEAWAGESWMTVSYESTGRWEPTQAPDPRRSSVAAAPPAERDMARGLEAFFGQVFGAGGLAP